MKGLKDQGSEEGEKVNIDGSRKKMKKTLHFVPVQVCSSAIDLTVEDGIIKEISFTGGCHGNLQGISLLAKGMRVEHVVDRLEGIRCGSKQTSCPDQLVKALRKIQN